MLEKLLEKKKRLLKELDKVSELIALEKIQLQNDGFWRVIRKKL